ncbi:MAG: ParB N-terminal domain-containing protein [Bacteroidales bacterium]|nr:ParB N-terminal domain-containing protein [Bacteroidales bacterium]
MTTRLKQSETRNIKRSEINLNPFNPKRHTEEAVKLQKKNLQKVGFLGGIVWNEQTGNLIDGHRRVKAMDLLYKYDGTPDTDYTLKVEVVSLDEKAEKEQLTYMAVGNTKADIDLIARYAPDIDLSDVGLGADDLAAIGSLIGTADLDIPDIGAELFGFGGEQEEQEDEYPEPQKSQEEKTQHVKEMKRQVEEKAEQQAMDEAAYCTLSFSNYDNYLAFVELVGAREGDRFIKGERVLEMID